MRNSNTDLRAAPYSNNQKGSPLGTPDDGRGKGTVKINFKKRMAQKWNSDSFQIACLITLSSDSNRQYQPQCRLEGAPTDHLQVKISKKKVHYCYKLTWFLYVQPPGNRQPISGAARHHRSIGPIIPASMVKPLFIWLFWPRNLSNFK